MLRWSASIAATVVESTEGQAHETLLDPEIKAIRKHIDECVAQSVEYRQSMKEALTWWTTQFIDGLRKKVNDAPDEAEHEATILALAVAAAERESPRAGQVVYFEMAAGLPQVKTNAAVHIFSFSVLPSPPDKALRELHTARHKLRGKVVGVEEDTGAYEVEADWEITGGTPTLRRTPQHRFQPPRGRDTIQVRVEIMDHLKVCYEYMFRGPKEEWLPIYDQEASVLRTPPSQAECLTRLNLDPPEDGDFILVNGLEPKVKHRPGQQRYALALERTSPESGSYVLFSQWRRRRNEW